MKKSEISEIRSTYREMTEWVRSQRNCFACDEKHTERCKKCPPPQKLKDILCLLSIANKVLKNNGYRLPTEENRRIEKVDRKEENYYE